MALNMSVLTLCKFTPLGFETQEGLSTLSRMLSVNLPRWGLKRYSARTF